MSIVAFHIAPVLAIAGSALLAFRVMKKGRRFAENARQLQPISDVTMDKLLIVGELYEPYAEAGEMSFIPFSDIVAVYLNSRENRRIANEERVNLDSPECRMLLAHVERDHSKIKKMAIASFLETCVGTLNWAWSPVYSRILLWTYAEEQELINHLAEYCADHKRQVILSRLY